MKVKIETVVFPNSIRPSKREIITIWYGEKHTMINGVYWVADEGEYYIKTGYEDYSRAHIEKHYVKTGFENIDWADVVYWAPMVSIADAFRAQFKYQESLETLRKNIEYYCKCVVESIKEEGSYIRIKAFVDSEYKAYASKTYDEIVTYINRNCTAFNKEFSISVYYKTLYWLGEQE